jgi:outer membrane protein
VTGVQTCALPICMITATDYLIAKNNYSNALSNLIHAKYNYLFTTKILDFYQGNPIKL